ncbi:unnamed protein product [Didymodactylos carnosus]|uniref:Uncharacterized protein n=1 Tax=Didymodactylos carnosus TaxID=1234261 RepID=A0A8S2VFH9_9BILA|nr:unnamed protein product [Didymodactylos carnosus]
MIKQDGEDEQQGDEQEILENEYGDSNDENLSNDEDDGSKSPTQKRKRALATTDNDDGDSGEDNAPPIQAITSLRNTSKQLYHVACSTYLEYFLLAEGRCPDDKTDKENEAPAYDGENRPFERRYFAACLR